LTSMMVVEMKNVLLVLSFTVGCISALQCDVPGECVGNLIGFTSQNSSTECLSTCKDTEECTWYTFVGGDNFCSLLQSCTEVNEDTCGTCVSGEVACPLLCGAPGLCQGVFIHTEDASSTSACQDACTNFNGCNFYSFDPTTEECLMFDTCPTLNDDICPDCISGTPECATGDEDCPDGWEVKPEFGKCYYYIDESVTWSEANLICKALDPDQVATLTSIRSQAENDYVFSLIGSDPSWLSGNDYLEEGVWRWVDDGSLVDDGGSYTNWEPGQPNEGESANCMYMWYDDGTWYDYSCDAYDGPYYAVCSKPIASAAAAAHNITRTRT